MESGAEGWLRVDHLMLDDVPPLDTSPYQLQVRLNRMATEQESKLFAAEWDDLASPELHEPGHAWIEGDLLTFDATSREEFFLRHRGRLTHVLQAISRLP